MGNPMERGDQAYEFIIVGAGPAGIQAAYFLEKHGSNYNVLEAGPCPGHFFVNYPRHRQLISINKRFNYYTEDDYNLRHDWNSLISDDPEMRFTKYSDKLFPPADLLVTYINDYVKKFNLKVTCNTTVENIRKEMSENGEEEFVLRTSNGPTYRAKVVIMATGAMKEKVPDIPGIELANTYSKHSIRQEDYENKKICVVGGGNSGFETADHLSGHAAIIHIFNDSPFKLAWDTHFPGHLRAINNNILDMFHLKSIHALRKVSPTKIEEIFENGKRQLKVHYDQELPHWETPCTAHLYDTYDDIIFCAGWYYVRPEMFDDNCRPEISPCGKYPLQQPTWESTNVKNLFFAGTCTQGRDRKAASSFIHGFRYSARCLVHLLENWRHNVPLPMKSFDVINLEEISQFVIKRLSVTSALYQLNYGVLCDMMVIKPSFNKGSRTTQDGEVHGGSVQYYYELPTEWALNQDQFKKEEHLWVLLLKDHKLNFPTKIGAMDFTVPPRMKDFDLPCQGFIQPVLRRYNYGEMVQECALGGNFVVRLDTNQLPGDLNPTRYGNKVKTLLCKQLGISGEGYPDDLYSEESSKTMFTPWSQERIDDHKMMEAMINKPRPCGYTMEQTNWVRKGTNIEVIDQ